MPGAAAEVEEEFERVRLVAGIVVDPTLLRPFADDLLRVPQNATTPAQACAEIVTFGTAYERYINDPTHRWSDSTRRAYETSRNLAVSVLGSDVPIASIARIHCRDYLDVLRHLPLNSAKRFPKLTAREASQRAKQRGDIEIISAANANVNLSNLSSFLNWAVNEELLVRNPMRGLRLPDDVAKRDKRLPFSTKQLKVIFNAPLYRGCLDGERGYAKPGQERPRNARFWVPLIALHCGMRLSEIVSLDVADVRLIDGIYCFVVSEVSLVGSRDKTLKTSASERLVPIHRTLIECGLLACVEQQRAAKRFKLFEEIDPGPRGRRAIAFSKWFTQFSRACGAYQDLTSFHSFRHNFRDELRAARIDHDIAMVLGGWTTGRNASSASENYGSGHRVGALHEAINELSFAEIDLTHLRIV
jgi:integrase